MSTAGPATTSVWRQAVEVQDLARTGRALVRIEGLPVVCFQLPNGGVVALDNRCPHEGYPLFKGELRGEVLSCCWHNFQFDLLTGKCIKGDEDPRHFPTREVAGWIEVDVAEPDRARETASRLVSLAQGLQHNRLGQVARDITRLRMLGMPSRDIALVAAHYDAAHAEFGSTHVLPVVADILPLLTDTDDDVLRLLLPFEMAAESHVRQPIRAVPPRVDAGEDPVAAGSRLREAAEGGDVAVSEGILRDALARGWGPDIIRPWLDRLVGDHFLDIGHALIYQIKVFDLLDDVGWAHASALLPAHLCRIVQGTREDTLPEWHWFRARLPQFEAAARRWTGRRDDLGDGTGRAALTKTLIHGDRTAAFDAVEAALAHGAGLDVVADALCLAAAQRVLDFDPAIDLDPTLQDDWLDVTHVFTYAEALTVALARMALGASVRLLAYGVYYLARLRALCPPGTRSQVTGAPAAPETAAALERRVFHDRSARPIVVAHYLKLLQAARAMERRTHDLRPIAAAAKFIGAPIALRRVPRLAHEAIRFVVSGSVPKRVV